MDLKQLLLDLDSEDLKGLNDEKINALTYEMLEQLGTTDPELRDGLIYPTLAEIIGGGRLSGEELNRILEVCLDEQHLFCKLGEQGDSVFMRSFTSLIIVELLVADSKKKFLSQEAFSNLLDKAIWYIAGEVDTRGYVEEKGWAHSIAHGADMLAFLVHNPAFARDKTQSILDAVENCLFKGAPYADDEDVRLVFVIKALMEKGLDEHALKAWLLGMMEKLELQYIAERFSQASYRNLKNVRDFVKSLYFIMKMGGGKTGLRVDLLRMVKELHKLQYENFGGIKGGE